MRALLRVLFAIKPLGIVASLVVASRDRSIPNTGGLWADPLFKATLLDAYAGVATFYVWVAHKEPRLLSRVFWLVFIMGLGNIVTATHMLVQLARMQPGDSWEALLLRRRIARPG